MVEAQAERDTYRVRFHDLQQQQQQGTPGGGTGESLLLQEYLGKIAELETENRALRGTRAVTEAFAATRRLSLGLAQAAAAG